MGGGESLIELALRALTTYFATVGPIDVAVLYAALTAHTPLRQKRQMAIKGTVIATTVLAGFVLAGDLLLRLLGVTLAAMRAAGGILLLLLALDMIFGRPFGVASTTRAETVEAESKNDLSVFPLAMPLIAGPAAIGASVLLAADAGGGLAAQAVVLAALLLIMLLQLALLLIAGRLHMVLGVTGQTVIARIVGILLAALAVQYIFDGIRTGVLAPA
jgi:multiple antibiotic resistance protein